MEVTQIIDKLTELADPRAVNAWRRVYGNTDNFIGVNLTKLKDLAKTIKRHQGLFEQLWATKIVDARLLATMVGEPRQFTSAMIDLHMQDIQDTNFPMLADKYCQQIIVKTKFVADKIAAWQEHPAECFRRSAYILIRYQAGKNDSLPETYFLPLLAMIAAQLQQESNWVKEMMHYALMAIGERSLTLNAEALKIANAIGPVHIDYGDTSCKTPNAITVLQKAQQQLIATN